MAALAAESRRERCCGAGGAVGGDGDRPGGRCTALKLSGDDPRSLASSWFACRFAVWVVPVVSFGVCPLFARRVARVSQES